MPNYDFSSQRLFIEAALTEGITVQLAREQSHYLLNVLRLRNGNRLLVFNGRDGEWQAKICEATRKDCALSIVERVRSQTFQPDLWYAFAPLKSARLDYVVQKAVEMGATRILPVFSNHTQVSKLNSVRMRANAIEAAEQCGILNIAEIASEQKLGVFIEGWRTIEAEGRGTLVFCDERAEIEDPIAALKLSLANVAAVTPICVLIGPEGGFDATERQSLLGLQRSVRLALGPRILRADTAAVAALALVQAVLGDWGTALADH